MIVVDTSVILAFMNESDAHHRDVSEWIETERRDLVTTPLIIAEVDYLLASKGGERAARVFRSDLVARAYTVDWWAEAIDTSVSVADRYGRLGIGLAEGSLVALAHRLSTVDIATLDDRHFRAIRPLSGGDAFRLIPRDL